MSADRKKSIELAVICNRLFQELGCVRHSMLVTEKLRKLKTPMLAESGGVYWPMIDRQNLMVLAISLSKVQEVCEKYGQMIPSQYLASMKKISQELSAKKIRSFRNTHCGHILNKKTGAPLSHAEITAMFAKIRGSSSYDDFEDWFWATGRPGNDMSIASTLEKIRDTLIRSERISELEMELA